jgi:hypothetical protein
VFNEIPFVDAASSIYFPAIDVFDKALPIPMLFPKPVIAEFPIFMLPVRAVLVPIFIVDDVDDAAISKVDDVGSIDDDFNDVIVSVPCAVGYDKNIYFPSVAVK